MKIALAQQNYLVGDFAGNLARIRGAYEDAIAQGAELVVFSELSLCGYPPMDFLEFHDFLEQAGQSLRSLAEGATEVGILVGLPTRNPDPKGKGLFNSAALLYQGKVQGLIHKTLLPTYDIFDEVRYFESNKEFKLLEFKGKKLAVTICEDLWNTGDNPLYTVTPMDALADLGADLIINLSASPFDYRHAEERKKVLSGVASRYRLPVFYCNTVGAQTELIFDGGSCVYDATGALCAALPYFKEAIRVVDSHALTPVPSTAEPAEESGIYEALCMGVRDYFRKLGFRQAVLGLSGGIDSALVAVLAVAALGKENVRGVLMPSEFSSAHSVTDATALCANLGIAAETIPIQPVYQSFLSTLEPSLQHKPFDVTEENLQARIRGALLMALCNKHHYILLNTSNKSEAAVGYGTLYGDMCGGLAVIADLYKTQVYSLCRWINREQEIIPAQILEKEPSAELRPGQKDSDSLPPYEVLDRILLQYIEFRKGPAELISMGFEPSLVNRVLKLVNTNEYKRQQTPPVLRISPKAFGKGRRMPVVGKYLSGGTT